MPLRLAIATPRFWPLPGDDALHALHLATEWSALGHEVTVVTPQWKRSWPRAQSICGASVVRLPGAPHGPWAMFRWLYHLGRWLREPARASLDATFIYSLGYEAYVALVAAADAQSRLALLAHERDLHWEQQALFGHRVAARCRQADCVIAPTSQIADTLIASGYRQSALHVIPRGAPRPCPHTRHSRAVARAMLAAANYDLATAGDSLVALAIGRFDDEHYFSDLVRAWRIVRAQRPEARLWLVGDGPERDKLYRQIGDLDQRFRILLPGWFDCLDDLLLAADLAIFPAAHASPPLAMLAALAAGIPVVTAASPSSAQQSQHHPSMQLFPQGNAKALAAAIANAFAGTVPTIDARSPGASPAAAVFTSPDEAAACLSLIQSRPKIAT